MGYLLPAEYVEYGLTAETADAWVTAASSMIEGYCRRPSLLAQSYTERMRVPLRAQSVRLSYGPLVSVDAVQAKYVRSPRMEEGTMPYALFTAFGACDAWVPVDMTTLDLSLPTGEFRFTPGVMDGVMGVRYGEVEVTYTAGLAVIPDAVKVACAQIVMNAQSTPGLNVKSSKMDTLQTQYFSDSLLDSQVQAMLRPYVAERLG
jgi:hypothetical protein